MEFKLNHEDSIAISVLQDLAGSIPSGTTDGRLINTELWQRLLPIFRKADKLGADFTVRGEIAYASVKVIIDTSHEGAATISARLWANTSDGEWKLSDEAEFMAKADDFLASASFEGRFAKVMDEFVTAFGEAR